MSTKQPVTIFGATGKIGKQILHHLSQAEIPTLAVSRDLRKAVKLPFVDWVQADITHKASLPPTIGPGGVVFLASPMNELMVEGQTSVIRTVQQYGLGHVVKLSSGVIDEAAHLPIAKAHGQIEAILQDSGLSWTMVRPNGFMQNWLGELAHSVKQERTIYEATGDGKRAYIDLRDIAEVAFRILTAPQDHVGRCYSLTGPTAINYTQLANCIQQTIGQPVTYVALTTQQAQQRMEQRGLPGWAIETFLAYAQQQRAGLTSVVSTDVTDILHRPARSMEAFIDEYQDCFN